MSREQRADKRMEEIILAIKGNDKVTLSSLFSMNALNEANDFDNELNSLFNYIQGDIVLWERVSLATSERRQYGSRSLMIRFAIAISTDIDDYRLYVIDYNIDNIEQDNEGLYMLEISKSSYSGGWDPWQDRMRAGIFIIE